MVKISASPHFPRLLGRTPNAFQIPPRPLDWRTGTSHSSRIDSPPPPCLVLPNEDKWVHSPPIPGTTLYLTVLPYKAGPPCSLSFSIHWLSSPLWHHNSLTAIKTYLVVPLYWSCKTPGSAVERELRQFGEEKQRS